MTEPTRMEGLVTRFAGLAALLALALLPGGCRTARSMTGVTADEAWTVTSAWMQPDSASRGSLRLTKHGTSPEVRAVAPEIQEQEKRITKVRFKPAGRDAVEVRLRSRARFLFLPARGDDRMYEDQLFVTMQGQIQARRLRVEGVTDPELRRIMEAAVETRAGGVVHAGSADTVRDKSLPLKSRWVVQGERVTLISVYLGHDRYALIATSGTDADIATLMQDLSARVQGAGGRTLVTG